MESTNPNLVFDCDRLITIFNNLFSKEYATRLIKGGKEPFYKAAKHQEVDHQLIFREDFFSSALHEVAHWCLAGEGRLLQDDFGYWYESEQRDLEAQRRFFAVEIKPQALEAIFSKACGYPFEVSVDNHNVSRWLNNEVELFAAKVAAQIETFQHEGLPTRAQKFEQALKAHFL
ncbi:MAG: elongation factor P hydroxylase [Pseudomonadota bacterium]